MVVIKFSDFFWKVLRSENLFDRTKPRFHAVVKKLRWKSLVDCWAEFGGWVGGHKPSLKELLWKRTKFSCKDLGWNSFSCLLLWVQAAKLVLSNWDIFRATSQTLLNLFMLQLAQDFNDYCFYFFTFLLFPKTLYKKINSTLFCHKNVKIYTLNISLYITDDEFIVIFKNDSNGVYFELIPTCPPSFSPPSPSISKFKIFFNII
jgi:hypothetical protein